LVLGMGEGLAVGGGAPSPMLGGRFGSPPGGPGFGLLPSFSAFRISEVFHLAYRCFSTICEEKEEGVGVGVEKGKRGKERERNRKCRPPETWDQTLSSHQRTWRQTGTSWQFCWDRLNGRTRSVTKFFFLHLFLFLFLFLFSLQSVSLTRLQCQLYPRCLLAGRSCRQRPPHTPFQSHHWE